MNGTPGDPFRGPPGRARYLGFGFLALALLMWAMVPVVGEAALWVSAVLLGREVVRRYRSCLDPRRLFRHEGP